MEVKNDERIFDIELHPSGEEVAVGSFKDDLIIPIGNSAIDGLSPVIVGPSGSSNYCGDSNYSNFGVLEGSEQLDGFTLNVIDPDRSPYDFYIRYGAGCDLSIPELCIDYTFNGFTDDCPDQLIECSPYFISAINQVAAPNEWDIDDPWIVGYNYNVSWVPSETGQFLVTSETNVTATISSLDGCYTNSISALAEVHPDPEVPLITDSEGINDDSPGPLPIIICPGTIVDLSANYLDGYDFYWAGLNVEDGDELNNPLQVSEEGFYVANVVNEFGCISTTIVQIQVESVPEIVDPYLNFENDSITFCGNGTGNVSTFDNITGEGVQVEGYDWEWTISPSGSIFGEDNATFTVDSAGWYVIELFFETEENPCIEPQEYTISDSIYIDLAPVPESFINISGPEFVCPGDSIIIEMTYDGELSYELPDSILVIFESDSLLILDGDGPFTATSSITNEFGCIGTASDQININYVGVPEIIANPGDGIICPGDSVQLLTNTPGNIVWQGPELVFSGDSSIYVNEPGSYFLEVLYYEGCGLISNTIELVEYSTPFLIGSNAVLCEGDSVEIFVNSSAAIDLVWLDPLSGNDSIQVISDPGVYYAQISSCGITITDSIEVSLNESELIIAMDSVANYCEGDSILVSANYPYDPIVWTPEGEGLSIYFSEPGFVQAFAVDTNSCPIISNSLELIFNEVPSEPLFDFEPVCEGEDLLVQINSEYDVNFIDENGNILIQQSQIIIENLESDTTIFAFLNSDFCVGDTSSIELVPIQFPDEPILGSNSPVCTGENAVLSVLNDDGFSEYFWVGPMGDGATGTDVNYPISSTADIGPYMCYANNQGCIGDSTFISIEILETRQVNLPPDSAMCLGTGFEILPDTIFQSYFWQDGSTDSLFIPNESGTYSLVTTDFNGCESFDFIELNFVDCNISIPNVFTPNGDGANDLWSIGLDQPLFVEVVVFNRWGNKVYESNETTISWDGVHFKNNTDCSEGVYFYILKVQTFDGAFFENTGNISLIRE